MTETVPESAAARILAAEAEIAQLDVNIAATQIALQDALVDDGDVHAHRQALAQLRRRRDDLCDLLPGLQRRKAEEDGIAIVQARERAYNAMQAAIEAEAADNATFAEDDARNVAALEARRDRNARLREERARACSAYGKAAEAYRVLYGLPHEPLGPPA